MEANKENKMNLVTSIAYKIALFPLSADADAEMRRTHIALRRQFNLNPDLTKRGDES